jgi:hypothetical protein
MQERLDTILSLEASGVGTVGTAETQTLETLLTSYIFLQTRKPKHEEFWKSSAHLFLCTCALHTAINRILHNFIMYLFL